MIARRPLRKRQRSHRQPHKRGPTHDLHLITRATGQLRVLLHAFDPLPLPPFRYKEIDMSVTPKRLEPENALRINEATAYPRIDAAQYYRDTANANAINRLSFAAIGRRYDGEIYYTIKGTYISLLEDPPLLQQMGCSDTSALTSIIAPLNTWLQSRAEIIQSGKNSESGLAASDEKIRDLGLEHVRHALLNLSTSRKRTLLIEDMRENGGTLLIPPRALLILPQAREIIVNSDVETVKSISFLTEMITPAGAACMLNSTTVFEGVKAGTAVRLQRPRKISLHSTSPRF